MLSNIDNWVCCRWKSSSQLLALADSPHTTTSNAHSHPPSHPCPKKLAKRMLCLRLWKSARNCGRALTRLAQTVTDLARWVTYICIYNWALCHTATVSTLAGIVVYFNRPLNWRATGWQTNANVFTLHSSYTKHFSRANYIARREYQDVVVRRTYRSSILATTNTHSTSGPMRHVTQPHRPQT